MLVYIYKLVYLQSTVVHTGLHNILAYILLYIVMYICTSKREKRHHSLCYEQAETKIMTIPALPGAWHTSARKGTAELRQGLRGTEVPRLARLSTPRAHARPRPRARARAAAERKKRVPPPELTFDGPPTSSVLSHPHPPTSLKPPPPPNCNHHHHHRPLSDRHGGPDRVAGPARLRIPLSSRALSRLCRALRRHHDNRPAGWRDARSRPPRCTSRRHTLPRLHRSLVAWTGRPQLSTYFSLARHRLLGTHAWCLLAAPTRDRMVGGRRKR